MSQATSQQNNSTHNDVIIIKIYNPVLFYLLLNIFTATILKLRNFLTRLLIITFSSQPTRRQLTSLLTVKVYSSETKRFATLFRENDLVHSCKRVKDSTNDEECKTEQVVSRKKARYKGDDHGTPRQLPRVFSVLFPRVGNWKQFISYEKDRWWSGRIDPREYDSCKMKEDTSQGVVRGWNRVIGLGAA